MAVRPAALRFAVALVVALVVALDAALQAPVASAQICGPPSVTNVTPAVAPAAGGAVLTITGLHFLSPGSGAPPTVRVGHAPAAIVNATDTQLLVVAPEQRDDPAPEVVVVRADGWSSPPSAFSYAAPVVDPAPAASVTRGGGTVLTVTGNHFRCAFPTASVETGTGAVVPARVLRASDTELVIELPDCPSPTGTLRLGIVHRDIAARNLLVSGPELAAVSPSGAPVAGGSVITLTGSGFGASGARVFAVTGGRREELSVIDQTDVVLRASATLPGSYTNFPKGPKPRATRLVVETASGASESRPLVIADSPVIERTLPGALAASTPAVITVIGDRFRSSATVSFDGAPSVPATVLDPFTLVCDAPPLAAGAHTLAVLQDGDTSPPLPLTVLAPPTVTSVSATTLPGGGGRVLTVVGTNFGPADPAVPRTVEFLDGGGQTHTNVGPIRWLSPESMRITTPAMPAGSATVRVVVAGVASPPASAVLTVGANSPPAPVISDVIPSTLTRLGGAVITLVGNNFNRLGTGTATVAFGSTTVVPSLVTNTLLTFVQPPVPAGQSGETMVVEEGGLGSNPLYKDHAAPTVNPLFGGASRTMPLAGGEVLTLTGSNFAPNARVRFGAGGPTVPAVQTGPTSLLVHAPERTAPGTVNVQVSVNGLLSGSQPLEYAGPDVSSASSRSLAPGGVLITVVGSDFGATPGRLRVGDRAAIVESWAPTLVMGHVVESADAPAQEEIRLETAAGAASDSFEVEWRAPSVTALDPPAVRAGGGTRLTIEGSDFRRTSIIHCTACSAAQRLDGTGQSLVVELGDAPPGLQVLQIETPGRPLSPPFEVERLAPPEIAGVTPGSGPAAGGILITVIGSYFERGDRPTQARFASSPCPLEYVTMIPGGFVLAVPPGTPGASEDLIVTVDGVSDTLPNAFAYAGPSGVDEGPAIPAALALAAGPSPFRDALGLRLALPRAGRWALDLFDTRGARLRRFDGESGAGVHVVRWDGRGADGRALPAGVYFARLAAAGETRVLRVLRLP